MTATFYTHSNQNLASGISYSQALRRYHGRFCASNYYRLGTIVELSSRSGHVVRCIIADRADNRTDYDLSPVAFRELCQSKRYKDIGRLECHARVVGFHSFKRKHSSKHKGKQ